MRRRNMLNTVLTKKRIHRMKMEKNKKRTKKDRSKNLTKGLWPEVRFLLLVVVVVRWSPGFGGWSFLGGLVWFRELPPHATWKQYNLASMAPLARFTIAMALQLGLLKRGCAIAVLQSHFASMSLCLFPGPLTLSMSSLQRTMLAILASWQIGCPCGGHPGWHLQFFVLPSLACVFLGNVCFRPERPNANV